MADDRTPEPAPVEAADEAAAEAPAEASAEQAPADDAQAAAERIMAAQAGTQQAPEGIEGAVGLGMDIVNIDRMRSILEGTPGYAERVFTAAERAFCDAAEKPHVHYATRFAAKQAVLKALGEQREYGLAPDEVEVARNAKGRPFVRLSGNAKKAAAALGVREIPISLSYTHTDAVACALAITDESIRATERRIDPMEELARQFKETRSLLDDIPIKRPSGEGGAGGDAQ